VVGGGIIKKGNYTTYANNITGINNLKRIKDANLISYKKIEFEKIIKNHKESLIIPNISKIIDKIKLKHTEKNIFYKNNIRNKNITNYSKNTIKKIIKELTFKKIPYPKILNYLISDFIFFSKIKEIKEIKTELVYNIEVNSDNEPNYFANHIPVHNCMIDELDKMSKEDRSAMHEALEQQTVTINKANIQATLRSETTVLAAANPKYSRFDPFETLSKQIDLPPSLLSRFDLIFAIRDLPNKDKDGKLAKFILNLHQNINLLKGKEDIEVGLFKKYISYAKTLRPKITDEAIEEIQNYYVQMRNTEQGGDVQSVPITARQLEALIRLAEASAKVRLSEKVTRFDAQQSIKLVHHCLLQLGLDPATGKIDVDRMTGGSTASERNQIHIIKKIIGDLEATSDSIGVSIENIIAKCEEKGISKEKVEENIEKLKRNGDIFEPKRGFIQKM
jgi:MoxR-like ATPase